MLSILGDHGQKLGSIFGLAFGLIHDHAGGLLHLRKDEESSHPLLLTLKHFRLLLKPSLPRRVLVQELVVVVARSAGYLPRSGDLEPLYRRLVCFDLWHLSSWFLA